MGDLKQCDSCGAMVPRLYRVWAYGLESYCCATCLEFEEDDEGDE